MSKKILIADDDPAILESVQVLLEDEGYEVQTTVDGRTVRDVKKDFPDLIILDIWMSGEDGSEICRYLKSNRETKEIPILMISANRDANQISLDAGADGFIAKPFDADVLLDMVSKHTGANLT